jgi:hypothetical protein
MPNPYKVGPPVHGNDHHGRIALLNQVLTGPQDCWCIIGLRRFGKTSFLHQLDYLARGGNYPFVPIFWDLQGCENEEQLVGSLELSIVVSESVRRLVGFNPDALDGPRARPDLLALLRRLASASLSSGRRLLLLCDECEALLKVSRNDEGLLGRLRSFFQSRALARTVLVGSRQLAELHSADMDNSAFLDGFEPLKWLPPVTPEELARMDPTGKDTTSDFVGDLNDLTGGHPYFVQAICSRMFEERSSLRDSIESTYHFYHGNIDSAFERDYRYLSQDERTILLSLKDQGPSDAGNLHQRLALPEPIVRRLLFTLEKSCYIKLGSDGRYTLANAFFLKWLSEKAGEPLRAMVSTVTEEAIIRVATQLATTPVSRKTEYDDFVLLIMALPGSQGRYQVRVVKSPAGEASEQFKLKPSSAWIQDGLRRLEAGFRGTKLLEKLGTALFKAVIHRKIGDIYRTSDGIAKAADRGLRVWLRIEPPELLVLPWELLFDPPQRRYLARSWHTPISHYIEVPSPHPRLAVKPPLRLLVVVSSPTNLNELNLPALDVAREKDQIARALHDWTEAKLVAVEMMDNAIVHEVHDRMRRFQPHVVHFIGHGGLISTNGRERGCLVLEDEQRQWKLVEGEQFCELMDHHNTRLVVLNACKTAASSGVRGMAGMAPRLVQAGMPAVVAMRYPILDDAAITFSREFYRALASGLAVDAAVADARKGLFLDEESSKQTDRTWFMPVLFMNAPDGRLFEIADQ